MTSNDSLDQLARVLESRKGGDPDSSYTARLLNKGPDAFLKKIGEEATELVMACKDADHGGDKSKIITAWWRWHIMVCRRKMSSPSWTSALVPAGWKKKLLARQKTVKSVNLKELIHEQYEQCKRRDRCESYRQ
jgi:phosphoribosyl-ATP pyrophosphohydrolase